MRIAMLTAEYPPTPGGVGDYTRQLGVALARRGLDVAVWTIREGALWSLDPAGKGAGARLGPASWGWSCWGAVAGAQAAERRDVLHIQYQTGAYGMHPAINLLPGRLRRVVGRPRLAVTAHDLLLPYLFPKAGPARAWVTRRLLEDCDAAVVTNVEDADALAGHAGPQAGPPRFAGRLARAPELIPIGSNIAVAPPPGYARPLWRQRLGCAPGDVLLAYFGLISPTKGLDAALAALGQLPTSFRLLIIGGEATAPQDRAYAAALRAQIERPPLAGRVTITGHCGEHEVSAHMLASDIGVLPFLDGASFRRGSLLATLAHSLPVVTTRPAASLSSEALPQSERLTDGASALLVPPGDPEALARAVRSLAGDAPLRARLAAGGHELSTRFGWESIAARHEQLYRALLKRP
jgi:glycosyltransferase involved in cell wall biosynthesis